MSGSLTLALLLTAAATVGCSSKPALEISRLDPRDGGGVVVSGVRPSYDGLAEKDTSTHERVEIDDDGHVRSDDVANPTGLASGVGLLNFADGSQLELTRPTGDLSPTTPQSVQGIDGQGKVLWQRTLPISDVVASTTDGASAFVLGGGALQPTDGTPISGIILVKLTENGDLGWTSHPRRCVVVLSLRPKAAPISDEPNLTKV